MGRVRLGYDSPSRPIRQKLTRKLWLGIVIRPEDADLAGAIMSPFQLNLNKLSFTI